MKPNETIERVYGSIPKEVGLHFDFFDWVPVRGVRYYWILLKRKITR